MALTCSPGCCLRSLPRRRRGASELERVKGHVGGDAERAQRAFGDAREHRRGDRAAVVLASGRLVHHHRDHDARIARRGEADEGRDVLARITTILELVRGTGLARHRVAGHLGADRGAAGTRRHRQNGAHLARGVGREHAAPGTRRAVHRVSDSGTSSPSRANTR